MTAGLPRQGGGSCICRNDALFVWHMPRGPQDTALQQFATCFQSGCCRGHMRNVRLNFATHNAPVVYRGWTPEQWHTHYKPWMSAASCEGPCLLRETSTSITRACFPKSRDAGTKMRRFPPAATQAHKDVQKPKRARFSAHACVWPSAFIRQNSCMHHLQRLNILTRSLQQKHSTSAIPAFMVNSASTARRSAA